MQQLTELQEKWLKALESGEYSQCGSVLHDGKGYCCLGVACLVAGLTPYAAADGYNFNHKTSVLPPNVREAFRFRGDEALIDGGVEVMVGPAKAEYLTWANDHGATFADIAAFVRANPEKVFFPPEAV